MSKGGRERKEGGGASKLPEFDSLHMCHGESDSGRLQSRSGGREWWTRERSVVEWERSIHVLANFRTNLHVTLRVGSWATESPGWVVGCRVSEQEGASGVVRTCESIW